MNESRFWAQRFLWVHPLSGIHSIQSMLFIRGKKIFSQIGKSCFVALNLIFLVHVRCTVFPISIMLFCIGFHPCITPNSPFLSARLFILFIHPLPEVNTAKDILSPCPLHLPDPECYFITPSTLSGPSTSSGAVHLIF